MHVPTANKHLCLVLFSSKFNGREASNQAKSPKYLYPTLMEIIPLAFRASCALWVPTETVILHRSTFMDQRDSGRGCVLPFDTPFLVSSHHIGFTNCWTFRWHPSGSRPGGIQDDSSFSWKGPEERPASGWDKVWPAMIPKAG